MKSKFKNIWRYHRRHHCVLRHGSYAYGYFFWILSNIKMKFGQILVCWMRNISNMFSTQCWRLKTSSRPFYDFIEITILRNVAISNSWYLPFLIAPYLSFQKSETLESWYNWLLSDWTRLLNWKGPGAWICSSPPNCLKDSWKLLPLLISISWPSLLTQWVVV